MRIAACLLVGIALCGVVLQVACADVTIEMKHNETPQVLYVAEHKVCFDSPEGGMIFRGDKEKLWTIDGEQKSFQEITKEDLQEMNDQMAAAKSNMEAAMKEMPPEQRAAVEKAMSGRLPSMAQQTERTVKPLGQKKVVNGFETAGYAVYRGGVLEEEVWAASPKALDLGAGDFAAFKELADFFGAGIPGMDDLVGRFAKDFDEPAENQVPGFPVLTIGKDPSGKEIWRSELIKVVEGTIDPSRFELPKGFKNESAED